MAIIHENFVKRVRVTDREKRLYRARIKGKEKERRAVKKLKEEGKW